MLRAAILLLTAALAAPVAQAAAPRCKAGQGRLVVAGKARCVAPGALLPRARSAASDGAYLVATSLDRTATEALRRGLVRGRLRGPAVGRRTRAAERALVRAAGGAGTDLQAAAAATVVTRGPVTRTANGVSGSMTVADPAAGTSATVKLTGKTDADGGNPVLDVEVGGTIIDRDKGTSSTTEVSMPLRFDDKVAETCPSATGEIRRTSRLEGRRTTRERRTPPGLDYRNETIKLDIELGVTGRVGADAALRTVEYTSKGSVGYAYAAAALRGVARANVQIDLSFSTQGTLDPRTGAVTGGTTSMTGRLRDINLSAREEQAALKRHLAGDLHNSLLRAVADAVRRQLDELKQLERRWQTPNTCATLSLTPGGATLDEGDTATVAGLVKAKDGAPAAGQWTLAARTRGHAAPLPATSGDAPANLMMIAEAPGAGNRTVDVTLRATSPAGVAEAPWAATTPPVPPLPQTIEGAYEQDETYADGPRTMHDVISANATWTRTDLVRSGDGTVTGRYALATVSGQITRTFTKGGCVWRIAASGGTRHSGRFELNAHPDGRVTYSFESVIDFGDHPLVRIQGTDEECGGTPGSAEVIASTTALRNGDFAPYEAPAGALRPDGNLTVSRQDVTDAVGSSPAHQSVSLDWTITGR